MELACDGSHKPGTTQGGIGICGYVQDQPPYKYHAPITAGSAYKTELVVLVMALCLWGKAKQLIIHSDCESIITSIRNWNNWSRKKEMECTGT